jgi:uncharacterized protein (TIGR02001 family)
MQMNLWVSAWAVALALAPAAGAWAEETATPEHSLSANLGAVSNYMWRGITQTDDKPAIQGGVDYTHSSGFALGTWVSNVDFGPTYEWDIYGSYSGKINDDFSYKANAIYYAYPDAETDVDFAEIGLSGTWKMLTLGFAYTPWGEADKAPFDTGDMYYYGSVAIPLPQDFTLGASLGYYDFDHDKVSYDRPDGSIGSENADYTNWGVSLSKDVGQFGTFSLNYGQNNGNDKIGYDNDAKLWVAWAKTF